MDRVFGILQEEFKGAMGFVGKSSVADIDKTIFAGTSTAAVPESVLV